jgi:ABC-type transporter Mla subunit MlaD
MQKSAPSVGKIVVAVGFALSCFGLLLFLWVTFGGSVPFKPKSYRFSADFDEAITLQKEADVRIGGVSVGKVKELELPEEANATRVVMEIDPAYAPISSDAMATLRQKTLLGETYVELTSGTQLDERGTPIDDPATPEDEATDVSTVSGDDAVEPIPEDGHLEDTQVVEQVQIDEIFNALDEDTRQAFQLWMRNSGIAINGQGQGLNDAFGNIGPFSEDASDVLATLRRQEDALRGVVRNTGTVFEALTARDQELAGAIVGTNRTFRALASRDQELAETFQIFPTFNNEARLLLERLELFAGNAGPLFRDLKPVARDISPTLRDLRRLAPNARRLFKNLDPLIKESRTGLPALTRFLDALRPTMVALDPFLANFNPIVRYLDYYKPQVADFLANPSAGTAGALPATAGQPTPRHLSRQGGIINAESLSIYPQRRRTNRGNGYPMPYAIGNFRSNAEGEVFPSMDCENADTSAPGNEVLLTPGASDPSVQEGLFPLGANFDPQQPIVGAAAIFAPCTLQSSSVGNFPAAFGGGRFPQVLADP